MKLHRCLDGALALISGREVVDVARIVAPTTVTVAGLHGLERRDACGARTYFESEGVSLTRVAQYLKSMTNRHSGIEVEEKGVCVAVHYRRAPHLAGFVQEVLGRLVQELGERYVLQAGKMVLELMPAGRDKGAVIADFMVDPPFHGRTPVFIGDDDTDESGFAVVNSMDGLSIKVGSGPTIANWRVRSVIQVWSWLRACANALERTRQ